MKARSRPSAGGPRPLGRRLRRFGLLVPAVVAAWAALFVTGPLVFLLLATMIYVVDLWLRRGRSAAFRADLRQRRRRALDRALTAGAPPDDDSERRVPRPDANEAETSLFGRRMPGLIRGGWPRGRI